MAAEDSTTKKELKMAEIFQKCDTDHSGYLEKSELRFVLNKMGLLDPTIHEFLLRRYDNDYNGVLDLDEFCEMMLAITEIKKKFHQADKDDSGAISIDELPAVLGHMNLSDATIKLVLGLFDVDSDGEVGFSEFVPFMIYINELLYQYDKYKQRDDHSTKWLRPLLGTHPDEESVVARKLKELKQGGNFPTMDQFTHIIVAAATITDKSDFRRVKAPQIVKVRNRVRGPPKKQLRIGTMEIVRGPSSVDHLSPGQFWEDPAFPADRSVLPARARKDLVWKRLHEINADAKIFVNGVEEGDVIQGALGDCWVLGALAVVATSTDNYIEHMFVKQRPDVGYYAIKFFKSGEWKTVEIDDRLPCYPSGQLYYASCKDPTEFWVPIVEKAYAKLHGSYEALEGGSISDGLKDLTGGGVDIVRLEGKEDPEALWDKLRQNAANHYLMGCSIDRNDAPETALPCGLLVNHAYSIIRCVEINNVRLIRIRNPWGQGEWTGAWSDDSKEWSPTLLGQLDYEFANDGTFFMSFEDFIAYFNRIFVLRSVTQEKTEWVQNRFNGEWAGPSAAGCLNNPNWLNNPQYYVRTKEPNTQFFINLSQPDLRYTLKKNPASIKSLHKNYHAIGLYVLKLAEPNFRKTSYTKEDKIAASPFTDIRDLSFEFTLKTPGHYILLPCTFHEGIESKFELAAFANKPVDAHELTRMKPSKSLKSQWKGPTAGGCVNYRETFMNNPQFLLVCNSAGPVEILLSQVSEQGKELEAIAIYVLAANGRTRQKIPIQILVKPKVIGNDATISETLNVDARETYIIMPTLFDPVIERQFVLKVASEDERMIETFEELH